MSLNQFEWLEDYDDLFEEKIPSQLLQNPLLQKDIWHTIDDLNLKISLHQRRLTLSFKDISPDWFKLLVKLYVLVKSNLHYLPEPIQRMVLVIKTTGIRVGELLNIPLDCLRKRGKQWRLRFTTEKYDIEDEIPIAVPELIAVIKEQQDYIKEQFGNKFDKLFCSNKSGHHRKDGTFTFSPHPKVMSTSTFNLW